MLGIREDACTGDGLGHSNNVKCILSERRLSLLAINVLYYYFLV